jgi:hypothetical protein
MPAKNETRDKVLTIRVTSKEKAEFEKLARQGSRKVSDWARFILLRTAQGEEDK